MLMITCMVTRRDGTQVAFDPTRISNAIAKAAISVGAHDKDDIKNLTELVVQRVQTSSQANGDALHIEKIQDLVEEELLKAQRIEIARSYITYRAERNMARETETVEATISITEEKQSLTEVTSGPDIRVKKRDGEMERYNADKINKAIEQACHGLTDPVSKVVQIATELELALYDGITTEELDQSIVQVALQNIKEDPEYDTVATRVLLKTQYKLVLGNYHDDTLLPGMHKEKFKEYVQNGVHEELLDPRLTTLFDLDTLAETIDCSRDELFKYIGLNTVMNRYMIRYRGTSQPMEVPQFFWMRVAMGFSLNEKNPTEWAIKIYNKISNLEYIPAGSSLIHAGSTVPRLSNCFLLEMQDSIEHIGKTVSDVMKLTKATGGIGLGVTKLRSEGSPIKKSNAFSSGPIPFMHVIDSAIRAVSRAGKKLGALCFYMENWHLDFPQFLDLKQNSGDEYRRTRTANTAVYISDEFMKRVKNNDDWYLFDPLETPDLVELYGNAFSKRYAEYIEMAEAGKIRDFKKIKAREQYKAILVLLQTTSHPWLTWKDTINNRALNNNTGTIHHSNLCTEITLPQDENNIAVCNLASINLANHLLPSSELDWKKLEESARTAVRHLDNLVDITISPVPEAQNANNENRAVGLGIMGFTEMLEKKGIAYDSDESYEIIDNVMEFISYIAIDESANLAEERGAYANFAGSRWSKGYVPYDTLDYTEEDRDVPLTISKSMRMDWEKLRDKVKKGMRNATLLAIAPTASIGLVAGTTTSIDPRFAQIFSRATNRGKFVELNENLVMDLRKLGIWDEVKDTLVQVHGDCDEIPEIPNRLKSIYKTSFKISPYAFIEVAGRAQKWVDQAISRNMYLATRDIDEISDIYYTAWEKGLKTTYYLHMKPRHTAEQSTTKVNKAAKLSKKGFGAFKTASVSSEAPTPAAASSGFTPIASTPKAKPKVTITEGANTCPVDPQEKLNCESCQ